jgi:hypothetical protein
VNPVRATAKATRTIAVFRSTRNKRLMREG